MKPKILLYHDKSGCCFWRDYQYAKTAQRQGLADIRLVESKAMSQDVITEGLKWCDIANIRGLMDTAGLEHLLRYQGLGIKVVTDYDDLHFNASPFNPCYKHFGTEEVQVKDPTNGDVIRLWEDGKNGFDLKKNRKKFHAFKAIAKTVDLLTTTTIYLKNAIAEISGREDNISVIPNSIDFSQWKPIEGIREKYDDKFRFGWAVSNSHGEDWLFIRNVLTEFLKEHTDAKFVCIGDAGMDITSVLPKEQVEWYPFSDLWEYHYSLRMPLLGLDCAIAPLADTEFNRCKSPLKYAEYTAFGWPVIAQNMEPYSSHIVNGETGLLAKDKEEWLRCLNSLYSNKDLRSKLHFNAMFAVKELFDLEKNTKDWVDAHIKVLSGVTTNA